MSEVLTPEEMVPLPIEDQISQELVKHNYTEAKLSEFDEYLKLDIIDDDKESYLIIKDKRKEVKAYRVAVEKFCKFKREDAVKIQKAWVANENKLVAKLSKVEDHLEAKEKAYEKKIAEEKEARKRKQEEQLIARQQTLVAMGVLYADGNFTLGEVSYEFSLVKESEEDVWQEAILPKFKEEYEKTQAEQIEKDRLKAEGEAEFKRQQEEFAQKQKDLAEKEVALKLEADRQADEARKARETKELARTDQLLTLGLKFDFVDHFKGYDCFVPMIDLRFHNDDKWDALIKEVTAQVKRKKEEEAEQEKKEQERKDLQNKRYAEMYPYAQYSYPVAMDSLWQFPEDKYLGILEGKKAAFQKVEEDRNKQIAEAAAKKERERIEEEQRQAEVKRVNELGQFRMKMLKNYNGGDDSTVEGLGKMDDTAWEIIRAGWQDAHEATVKKEQEEKKAEELAQASDKVKWAAILAKIGVLEIHDFRSGPYRKRAAILREKLEEIKAL
jgi:hypothetical protein